MKPEQLLNKQVSNHLLIKYPDVPFRFDLAADMPVGPALAKRGKELHGKWNKGHPDLFVETCRKGYGGLFIELKALEKVPNNEHTKTQRIYHEILRRNGYKVEFACGFEEAKKILKKYLR